MLASAHHGVARGEPMYAICAQSKVKMDIPRPDAVPNSWLTTTFSGDDPADPVESREGGEDVAGEEVPAEGEDERIGEEAFTGDTAAGTDTGVLLRVEGVEERAGDEVGGPDHGGRLHEETTGDTTDRETDELGGHDEQPLVAEVVCLVVVHPLHCNDIRL